LITNRNKSSCLPWSTSPIFLQAWGTVHWQLDKELPQLVRCHSWKNGDIATGAIRQSWQQKSDLVEGETGLPAKAPIAIEAMNWRKNS
jgi:hypothetical protein